MRQPMGGRQPAVSPPQRWLMSTTSLAPHVRTPVAAGSALNMIDPWRPDPGGKYPPLPLPKRHLFAVRTFCGDSAARCPARQGINAWAIDLRNQLRYLVFL